MPNSIDIVELKRQVNVRSAYGKFEYGIREDGFAWYSIGNPKTGPHIQGDISSDEKTLEWIATSHNEFPELLSRLEAMQWMDISDAPKDGTEVLGIHVTYWDHSPPTIYGPFTMRWVGGCWQSCWDGSQVIEYVSDLSGITYRQIELPPTHYMPLPAPPEAAR